MRYVAIELDRPRRLRFDINSLAELEDVLGGNLFSVFQQDRLGIKFLRAFVWGGLRWEDKSLTMHQAGDLIQDYLERGGTLESLMQTLTKAIELSGLVAAGPGTDSSPSAEVKGGIPPF